MSEPRGVRNNNPGNIKDFGIDWQGLAEPRNDGTFCRFTKMSWGVRACIVQARNWKRKRGIRTLRSYMARFAPVGEENPAAYHNYVANMTGIPLDEQIDLEDRDTVTRILKAQFAFENGMHPDQVDAVVNADVWDTAWKSATPLYRSKTMAGTAGTIITAGAGAVVEVATQHADEIGTAAGVASSIWPKWAPVIIAAVVICFALVIAYAKVTDRKEAVG